MLSDAWPAIGIGLVVGATVLAATWAWRGFDDWTFLDEFDDDEPDETFQ